MRVDVARCIACNRIVPLPTLKARRVTCADCLAAARSRVKPKPLQYPGPYSGLSVEEYVAALFGDDDDDDEGEGSDG